MCLRNLKYVSRQLKEAQRIEKEKEQSLKKEEKARRDQERQIKKEKREAQRKSKLAELPEILTQKSTNAGVQAIRDAIRLAWLDSSLYLLKKHLGSAQQLNNDQGLLDEEIKICTTEIENISNARIAKFKEKISEDSEKINFRLF